MDIETGFASQACAANGGQGSGMLPGVRGRADFERGQTWLLQDRGLRSWVRSFSDPDPIFRQGLAVPPGVTCFGGGDHRAGGQAARWLAVIPSGPTAPPSSRPALRCHIAWQQASPRPPPSFAGVTRAGRMQPPGISSWRSSGTGARSSYRPTRVPRCTPSLVEAE